MSYWEQLLQQDLLSNPRIATHSPCSDGIPHIRDRYNYAPTGDIVVVAIDKMASNSSMAALARISQSTFRNVSRSMSSILISRAFSASSPILSAAKGPPLLVQMKTDLKTAMRAKDAPRLSVLRAVISASNDAAKKDQEVKSNEDVFALLQKTASGINQAVGEARRANRADLVEKEEAQLKVVEEYMQKAGLDFLSEDEIRAILRQRIAELRKTHGKQMEGTLRKETGKKGWVPEGRSVSMPVVMGLLTELLNQK